MWIIVVLLLQFYYDGWNLTCFRSIQTEMISETQMVTVKEIEGLIPELQVSQNRHYLSFSQLLRSLLSNLNVWCVNLWSNEWFLYWLKVNMLEEDVSFPTHRMSYLYIRRYIEKEFCTKSAATCFGWVRTCTNWLRMRTLYRCLCRQATVVRRQASGEGRRKKAVI